MRKVYVPTYVEMDGSTDSYNAFTTEQAARAFIDALPITVEYIDGDRVLPDLVTIHIGHLTEFVDMPGGSISKGILEAESKRWRDHYIWELEVVD